MKKYRSLAEVIAQNWRWIWKNTRMVVRIEGHDLIVERMLTTFLAESRISTWVFDSSESDGSGADSDCLKVLMHTTSRISEGWQKEEEFVEMARRAWFVSHMDPDAKIETASIKERFMEDCHV